MALSACVLLLLLLFVAIYGLACGQSYQQPEQIHISYGGNPSRMWITWVTFDTTDPPTVEYGIGKLNREADGSTTMFRDGGSEQRLIYVHRVLLQSLKPKTTYIYHVGSTSGWSAIYYFTTLNPDADGWSPRFAVFGDMGNVNAQSLARLQQEAQRGHFDMILHVGDMAYDMATIEPMAAYVPYMTVVGNHEEAYNFTHYVNRFSMPGNTGNLFYSFDVGPAHFISFSTEFYFFTEYGWLQIANQYQWLEQDLQAATANRKNVPWIITMGHRPMYCSNWDSDDCTKYESIIRGGLPIVKAYGLEELFYKYGVDMEIWAHEHSFERMWPLYNRTVFNGTDKPYVNPPAPVHIVTGSAGCQEHTDPFIVDPPPWSAFRSSQYGYSRMTVANHTHLYFEQVSDDQDGKVIDSMWLIKDRHGAYDEETRRRANGVHVPLNMEAPANARRCKDCSHL